MREIVKLGRRKKPKEQIKYRRREGKKMKREKKMK
jgi:hypothetical protein